MLRPLKWLENELEMENSQPIQSILPKPDFAYQQWKDSLSKDIDTKEDKEEFLLIGEQLSSVFPDEGSGCDNSTIENSSIKNVSAFNDRVTHNRHKKSKQKSEQAPAMEKKAKSHKFNARLEDSAVSLQKKSCNSSNSSFAFASVNDSLTMDSICSEGQEKKA